MTIFINYFLTNLMAKWFNLWGEYIRIIEPHEFEHYMVMMDKKPIDLDLFNRKLSAALIKANEQILPKE